MTNLSAKNTKAELLSAFEEMRDRYEKATQSSMIG